MWLCNRMGKWRERCPAWKCRWPRSNVPPELPAGSHDPVVDILRHLVVGDDLPWSDPKVGKTHFWDGHPMALKGDVADAPGKQIMEKYCIPNLWAFALYWNKRWHNLKCKETFFDSTKIIQLNNKWSHTLTNGSFSGSWKSSSKNLRGSVETHGQQQLPGL